MLRWLLTVCVGGSVVLGSLPARQSQDSLKYGIMYEEQVKKLDAMHAWAIEATRQTLALEGAISAPPPPPSGAIPGTQHWSTVNSEASHVRKYHVSPEALPGAPSRLYVVKQLLSPWEASRLAAVAAQSGVTARSEAHTGTPTLDSKLT